MLMALTFALAACGGGGEEANNSSESGGGGEEANNSGESGGGGETSSESGGGGVSGEIAIEGSSTVIPISEAAASGFNEENPDVQVSVGGAGTGDGFEAFCAGSTDISDASRAIKPEEIQVCEENGVEFIELPIAFDGLSVVVNPDNEFAQEITVEELQTMWEPAAADTITTWNQVRAEWPEEELALFGPGTESGTYDYFAEEVADPESEEPALRPDYESSEDDNVIVQGVEGEETALGFFGYSYFQANSEGLRALAVDGGDGGVQPSIETIADGTYPLSRPLFIYVNTQKLEENEALQPFIDNYLGNLGQYVEEGGYVVLPDETNELVVQREEDRVTGTLYNEEGEFSEGEDIQSALEATAS
jgi:phosphate transport system substrate-binding protein